MVTLCGRVGCRGSSSSSNNNNNNNSNSCNNNNNNKHLLPIKVAFAIWTILTLVQGDAATAQAAAVYSNVDFHANPNFEPICNAQEEHFIESDGKESSLILEFNPGVLAERQQKSCTRILSAPSNYGFIVRLILPKIRRGHHNSAAAAAIAEPNGSAKTNAAATLNGMTSLIEKLNSTALKSALGGGRTCPLSIFSSLDPHTPQWRVDPCQLEDTAPEMEDPVRLFHGRVRIVWEHSRHALNSKLMVTALGKGDQCRGAHKHPCLKIGDEPILCISEDLVCDGIRHCPYSNEYDSDEDYAMCWKRRRFGEPMPPAMESDIFEHFALEVFRNLFAFDVPTAPTEAPTAPAAAAAGVNRTTLRKVESKQMSDANATATNVIEASGNNSTAEEAAAGAAAKAADNATESSNSSGHHRRNSTRMGLNSDLSKYGPWGYLMLGMLLCGGALLICGLWASASQHATNNERESALQNAGHSVEHQSSSAAPPNYEELDPPPAYSVLFPNQKAASSTTLNSLGASTTLATATAVAVAACSGAGRVNGVADAAAATTTTHVQMEHAAAGSSSQQQPQSQSQPAQCTETPN